MSLEVFSYPQAAELLSLSLLVHHRYSLLLLDTPVRHLPLMVLDQSALSMALLQPQQEPQLHCNHPPALATFSAAA
jgi:hypothetical protein